MREIKFRAWDKTRKKMYSAYELGQDQETLSVDGRGFVNVSGDSTRLSQFHTHLLPLEFTGLKDKNGKEIYEGDILKTSAGNYPVIWDNDGLWGFDDRHPLYFSDINQREVIGNIYENPELIK